jgi:2-methylcitrate dehydratase PrpD
MDTLSRKLAGFIYNLRYDHLREEVIEQVKKCFLDFLGVSLIGSTSSIGKTLIKFVKNIGGVEESTVIGECLKVPCINAAFINGVLAHIHELDDGHRFAMGHPGAVVIPAALAVGERNNVSGKELITAIIAGYEVFVRIAKAVNPSHLRRGFHTTGTCGVFAAAAATGKILGLNIDELSDALGLAGIQAAGLLEVMRGESIAKPLQPGKAAQSGVISALLAQNGVSAPDTIFEGENGFCHAFSDKYDLQVIMEGLGESYEIMRVYFKFHASCRHTHSVIDGVLKLVKEYNILPEEIEEVQVKTYSIAYDLCGREYEPKTISTAKFSIPYCVSAAILHGSVGPEAFTVESIKDKDTISLARKVKVMVDPEIDANVPRERGAKVKIVKKNGEEVEVFIRNPFGEPEAPASIEDIKGKFKALASKAIPANNVNGLIMLVDKLESLKDIGEILSLLGSGELPAIL